MKKKCAQCGEILPDGVTMCPFCEAPVPQEEAGESVSEGPKNGDLLTAEEAKAVAIDVGTVIDERYEIEERIGAGPKGVVFKAHDKALDETVALRVIPADLLRAPEVVTGLKDELNRAPGLRHPNVAQVLNSGNWSGETYVVTAYIPGTPLRKWLTSRGGSVPPATALPLVKQIAAAVDALHSASPPLVHGSINPNNVMVTPEGAVKVTDVGLAPLLKSPQLRLAVEGDPNTLPFLAPEQVKGEAISPATDLYSFGALLFHLFTGRPPFSGDDVRWKIMFEEVAVPEELPDYVRRALELLLSKEPSQRPGASAVARALDRRLLLGEEEVAEAGEPAMEPSQPPPPPRRSGGIVAFVAVVVAVIAVGFFFLRGGGPGPKTGPAVEKKELPRVGPSQGELREEAQTGEKVSVESLAKAPPVLEIKVRPDKAVVLVDGKEAGQGSLTLKELTEGKHKIEVKLDKYQPFSKEVKLASGKRYTLSVKLEPEPFGGLEVGSNPAGAEILLDGKVLGKAPFSSDHVPMGRHRLALRMPCYATESREVVILPLKTVRLDLSMKPSCGTVELVSEPPGAELSIDGEMVGKTPYRLVDANAGEVTVALSKECFHPVESRIEIVPGKETSYRFPLKPACSDLVIESEPSGARLVVDGQEVGVTPYSRQGLKKDKLTLHLEKECYAPLERVVRLNPGKENRMTLKLRPTCSSLVVETRPEGAQLVVDGKRVGAAPFTMEKVEKERVSIMAEKECYAPASKEVKLKAGQENRIVLELKRICAGVTIQSQPEGATLFVDGKKVGTTPVDLPKFKGSQITVRLEKACYAPLSAREKVVPGKVTRLNYKLKPVCGDLVVESSPAGAEVYLDGKMVGKTPWKGSGLEAGKVELVVRQGMATFKKTVTIGPGKTTTVKAKLVRKNYWTDPITGMEFVWVEGGCFSMGCGPWQERCSDDEKPLHKVCLDGFWISRYEVTQAQWERLMHNNPSHFKGKDRPVEQVSWLDAKKFIDALNKAHGGKAHFYLPTEAEWEYACRSGGKEELFCGGHDEYSVAWFRKNSDGTTHPVGKKHPNGLKLYDMSGNVQEWCRDDYRTDFYSTLKPGARNPVAVGGEVGKVIRGGAYDRFPWKCRSSSRYFDLPSAKADNLGFRVVREAR